MLHVKALFAGVIVGLLFNITWDLMQANNFNFVSVEFFHYLKGMFCIIAIDFVLSMEG